MSKVLINFRVKVAACFCSKDFFQSFSSLLARLASIAHQHPICIGKCVKISSCSLLSGWRSSHLPRWKPDKPGQVSGLYSADPRSREGPVQVLGLPVPAGVSGGCCDGRAGAKPQWLI